MLSKINVLPRHSFSCFVERCKADNVYKLPFLTDNFVWNNLFQYWTIWIKLFYIVNKIDIKTYYWNTFNFYKVEHHGHEKCPHTKTIIFPFHKEKYP